jgi:hypothetical protein
MRLTSHRRPRGGGIQWLSAAVEPSIEELRYKSSSGRTLKYMTEHQVFEPPPAPSPAKEDEDTPATEPAQYFNDLASLVEPPRTTNNLNKRAPKRKQKTALVCLRNIAYIFFCLFIATDSFGTMG